MINKIAYITQNNHSIFYKYKLKSKASKKLDTIIYYF